MLSVCFRMKVIIALLQLLQCMITEAKKETFPERNGKKTWKIYWPSNKSHISPCTHNRQELQHIVEKEIPAWQHGRKREWKLQQQEPVAWAAPMEGPGPCILQVGDKEDREVSHNRRDISDGKDLLGHLSIPLPRQDYTAQYLPKKDCTEQFHMSRGME